MPNQSTQILYDHYKDTCAITGEAIKRRDRLMLFVVLILGFFAFQAIFPTDSNAVISQFLTFKFGLTQKLDLSVIGNVVWFLLLISTIRYFQTAVFVERQHTYVHTVEEKLNKELGEGLITRESKSYLEKYPRYSDWMWMLYTIIFPILLLIISAVKIFGETEQACGSKWSIGFLLDSTAFALLAVSIVLYLIMVHGKSKD